MMRPRATDGYDAVIIGGGIGALTAAAYLARGKARVLVLEARNRFGGGSETVEFSGGFRAPLLSHVAYALDPRMVRELRLSDHGFGFVQSNMKLVALRPGGKHIVLPLGAVAHHTGHAAQFEADERAYGAFHKEVMRFARALRPLWDGTLADASAEDSDDTLALISRRLQLGIEDSERFEHWSRLSAAAFLDRWFENDALKAALAFDVFPSGMSPLEAGSALVLIWRYAQENCLRQGAAGQIQDGTTSLARTLEAAARQAGAELRADTRVSSIIVEKRRAIGVIVEGGEMIPAKAVLSSLDARETLLRLVQAGSLGFGTATSVPDRQRVATAQILLALSGPPPFAGVEPQNLRARFVIAPRPETAAEAKAAALHGAFANELAMEMTVPTATDPALAPGGGHVVSALVPYLPREVAGGWEAAGALLRKRVLATLETFAPGLKDRVVAHRVITPDDASFGDGVTDQRFPLSRLLASYEARIRTPIDQLYLCGGNAEPVNAVSGRAGRLAAGFVFMARNP